MDVILANVKLRYALKNLDSIVIFLKMPRTHVGKFRENLTLFQTASATMKL